MQYILIANWIDEIVGFAGVSTNLGYVIFKKKQTFVRKLWLMITPTYLSTALSKKKPQTRFNKSLLWTC